MSGNQRHLGLIDSILLPVLSIPLEYPIQFAIVVLLSNPYFQVDSLRNTAGYCRCIIVYWFGFFWSFLWSTRFFTAIRFFTAWHPIQYLSRQYTSSFRCSESTLLILPINSLVDMDSSSSSYWWYASCDDTLVAVTILLLVKILFRLLSFFFHQYNLPLSPFVSSLSSSDPNSLYYSFLCCSCRCRYTLFLCIMRILLSSFLTSRLLDSCRLWYKTYALPLLRPLLSHESSYPITRLLLLLS